MILCCGEALIDMIPATTRSGDAAYMPVPGGAVFNTAVALGRLGVPVGMFTGLSADMFGRQLARALARSNVDDALVVRQDNPSMLAFVHLDEGQASYSFFDENAAGKMLREDDLPDVPRSVQALFFGGISLACEPGADTYAALARREASDRVLMLDPNIRPGFISDDRRFRARMEQMIARADIVKVSDEDLNWLFPGNFSLEEKAARLGAMGPPIIILTRGSRGATALLSGGKQVHVTPPSVQVRDTVGAGDTFNAGVLARLFEMGLLNREALRSMSPARMKPALELAAAVAGVTVSRDGADPPWRHELA